MSFHRVEFTFGGKKWSIETGELAKQATSSAVVGNGDNVVLVTLVCEEKEITDETEADFLPLTVEYREKTYAAGKFPGGFIKREGKLSTDETLVSRLIDRPIRSLFPKGFVHELQIIAQALSVDDETMPDILALVGASAATALSGIKNEGPISACRVGMIDGKLIINPTREEIDKSSLELVAAFSKNGVLMVESGSSEIDEETYVNALVQAEKESSVVIRAIEELCCKAGVQAREYPLLKADPEHTKLLAGRYEDDLRKAFFIRSKQERNKALDELQEKMVKEICLDENGEQRADAPTVKQIKMAYADFERDFCRKEALQGKRQDGRGLDDIRQISVKAGILPRTHGSALFTRGETQALGITTLGTKEDEQMVDSIVTYYKSFMLHYNFPPFSTGEAKPLKGPGRREIGHGSLAERALYYVIPSQEEFPYTIRVVSEVLESNGSTSMASVCAGTLSLMDAGVPIKRPVAGIAMGLIKSPNGAVVLTDILGSEDALGDMDFKVAGTEKGITALQMDLKTPGIDRDILKTALQKAKAARLFILGKMKEALPKHRNSISPFAPKLVKVKIKPDQIGMVIGPGGKVIKGITQKTGANIDIDDETATVLISSRDEKAIERAKQYVEMIVRGLTIGAIYDARVKEVRDFGCIVDIIPTGDDGMVHVSEIANTFIKDVRQLIKPGDEFKVKLFATDEMGRNKFSIKRADAELGIQQVKVPHDAGRAR